jgi:tRNA A37 threonylcarbamoyladenosine synthetase subunit TsaC/SUA5/YrdC
MEVAMGRQVRAEPLRCLESAADVIAASRLLADGEIVACGFANFYALVADPREDVVRHVNLVKGRPLDQVGSITTTNERIADCFDWSSIDADRARQVRLLIDALFEFGPFGFRGPAAGHVPDHLTQLERGVRTTQVIAPGRTCPSNAFFAAAVAAARANVLYITSANRSRHRTGAVEEPAHWTAAGIAADFADLTSMTILAHRDEAEARARYPLFALSSVTLLSFHDLARTADGRSTVTIDRHGSLHVEEVRRIARPFGFAVDLAATASRRLEPRRYTDAA